MDVSNIVTIMLLLLILLFLTLGVYYNNQSYMCSKSTSIPCWRDWDCPYSPKCTDNVDPKICWQSTEALYSTLLNKCKYPDSGGLPSDCKCAFSDTGASSICRT